MLAPIFLLSYSLNTYALSASTANTIQGTAPRIIVAGSAGTTIALSDAMTVELADGTVLSPAGLTTATLAPSTNLSTITIASGIQFDDGDGDGADSSLSVPGIKGLSYVWKNASGAVVANNALVNPCDGPYILTITATNLTAKSAFGAPDESASYGSLTQNYTLEVAGIRFLKTASTFGSPTTASSAYFNAATGFNKCKLDSMSLTFPSFGFPTANYNLIMAGSTTDYDYKLAVGGSVIADTSSGLQSTTIANVDSNGKVTLISKPNNTVIITTTHKTLNVTDTQQFTIARWGEILTTGYNTPTLAQTACGGAGKLFAGNEVSSGTLPGSYGAAGTNSPRILGTLLGEWGTTTDYTHFSNNVATSGTPWLTGGSYSFYAPGAGVYSNYYSANALYPNNVSNPWHTQEYHGFSGVANYYSGLRGAFCRR